MNASTTNSGKSHYCHSATSVYNNSFFALSILLMLVK